MFNVCIFVCFTFFCLLYKIFLFQGTKTSTNIKKSDERVFKTGNENEKTSLVTQPKKNENLSTSVTQIKNEKPNTLVNKQIKNKNPVTIVTKKIELRSCTKE